jgi:hypothetical protein
MRRVLAGAVIAGLILAAVVAWPGSAAKRKPQLKLLYGLGPEVQVAPGEVAENSAGCPRGYYVTGGGLYLGAIEGIVDGPSDDGRAWVASGGNPSTTDPFSFRVSAVCVRGQKGLKLKRAVSDKARRQAERDWVRARSN